MSDYSRGDCPKVDHLVDLHGEEWLKREQGYQRIKFTFAMQADYSMRFYSHPARGVFDALIAHTQWSEEEYAYDLAFNAIRDAYVAGYELEPWAAPHIKGLVRTFVDELLDHELELPMQTVKLMYKALHLAHAHGAFARLTK